MIARLSSRPVLGALAGALLGLLVGTLLLLLARTNDVALQNCRQIEAIKAEIRLTLGHELAKLRTPGSPGFAYYHAHPLELGATLALVRQELYTFRPDSCS